MREKLENNKKVSFIIRTKNEEKNIGECLKRVFSQNYKEFEVIIVDSGSTDKTLSIAKKYPVKIFEIEPEEFTFPYALNFGASQAGSSDFLVIISAHCFIPEVDWLERGLGNFNDPKVVGAYGSVWAAPGDKSSFWEKIFFSKLKDNFRKWFSIGLKKKIKKSGIGVLGFTNAIIRKEFWEKRKFNEAFGLGGEDTEWANSWLKKGYKIIRDVNLGIYHSHKLGLLDLGRQQLYWHSLGKPASFSAGKIKSHRGDSKIYS